MCAADAACFCNARIHAQHLALDFSEASFAKNFVCLPLVVEEVAAGQVWNGAAIVVSSRCNFKFIGAALKLRRRLSV